MEASITEIRTYFGYPDARSFRDDWTRLSEDEKAWFKTELGKVLHPEA